MHSLTLFLSSCIGFLFFFQHMNSSRCLEIPPKKQNSHKQTKKNPPSRPECEYDKTQEGAASFSSNKDHVRKCDWNLKIWMCNLSLRDESHTSAGSGNYSDKAFEALLSRSWMRRSRRCFLPPTCDPSQPRIIIFIFFHQSVYLSLYGTRYIKREPVTVLAFSSTGAAGSILLAVVVETVVVVVLPWRSSSEFNFRLKQSVSSSLFNKLGLIWMSVCHYLYGGETWTLS